MVLRWFKNPILTCLILALPLIFGCSSDDDPTDPGGGGPGDTTSPTVQTVSPEDGTLMVQPNDMIRVTFDEPMDTSSATGQVTVTHGTVDDLTWASETTLDIGYSGWPAATRVAVTLGVGLKDKAGNNLASTELFEYGSWSDNLALFETSPAGGATNINRSSPIVLDFIDRVESGQINSEVTITDGTKAVLPYSATSSNGSTWILAPDDVLPANTQVTVTIGMALTSEQGVSFPSPHSVSFTTNDQIDNTPPTIVSIEPGDGSTIPSTASEIVFTFSERINPDKFRPTEMNGQLLWLINMAPSEPSWNAAGDILTVPLPSNLPAGLELEAVFADYEDMAGNVQTTATPWEVNVAGTALPLPYTDGQRYIMAGEWSEGEAGSEVPTNSGLQWDNWQVKARGPSDQWNLEEWNDNWTEKRSYDIQKVNSSAIALIGFTEGDGGSLTEIMLGTDAVWAELPLVAGNKWDQEFSVVTPEGTIDVVLSGEVIGMGELYAGEFDGIDVTWTGAWLVRVLLDIGAGGETFSLESDENWYVPGVGLVRNLNREDKLEEGNTGWEISDMWLAIGEEN